MVERIEIGKEEPVTTQRFNRGLSNDFVEAVNEEYGKGGWWRNLVDDRKTFLAIRDDYVNVYYRGCSLLLLRLNENRLEGSVAYKYLLRPSAPDGIPEYVMALAGKPDFGQNASRFFLSDLADVNDLRHAVKPYAEMEKIGVHGIILGNPNVLDVEVAISDGGRAPRIDLAAVHNVDGGFEVRFYEAKHFSNNELRAKSRPRVLQQIEGYFRLLRNQHDDILNSYSRVCRNLSELAGMDRRHPERHQMLKELADSPNHLRIDTEPRLLVFGYDEDQKMGLIWKGHRDKLRAELGGRLKMTSDPKKLQLPN